MTENSGPALIVANPGPLRNTLRSMIIAMLQIEAVEEADDVSSALSADLKQNPALVFLDSDLKDEEIWLAMWQVREKWPQTRCIIL